MNDPVQEQLAQARRDQILDAATKVFSQKGFHNTTIRAIATEAGIADGTIYNYFKNKTALLIGIFHRMQTLLAPEPDEITALIDADFRTFLKAFIQLPLNTLAEDDFQLFKVIVSEMMTNPELKQLYNEQILQPTLTFAETYLQQWAQNQPDNTLDIPLTVRTISGLIMGLIMQNILGDETLQSNWKTLPDFLTDLLIQGLAQ